MVVTMKDIAQKAKVSRPTVSVILNGRDSHIRISKKTRDHVLQIASSLNYRRNQIAHAMVTGKTNFIGFMDEDIINEYTSETLSGAVNEASKHKYFIKIFPYYNKKFFKDIVNSIIEQRPAGIICRSLNEDLLEYLHLECVKFNVPVAIVGSGFFHGWGIRVATDDTVGAALAVNHLIDLGHKKIAHAGFTRGRGFVEMRCQGYINAMTNAGLAIPDEYFIYGAKLHDIEKRIGELAIRKNRPSAIFCTTDYIAMVVLRSLRKANLRVPQDVSIVGYADLKTSKLVDPPLSTIAEPFKEVGKIAVSELIAEIEKKEKGSFNTEVRKMLDVKLIVRASSTPPENNQGNRND